MKERIKQIMEEENLTAAKFAERLQVSRAVISHILNGRNNPSLDVVIRILNEMDYVNPEWLLNGSGKMYKEGVDERYIPKEPDLFNQPIEKTSQPSTPVEKASQPSASVEKMQGSSLNQSENHTQETESQNVVTIKSSSKEISQIIVYFTDQTFKVFKP